MAIEVETGFQKFFGNKSIVFGGEKVTLSQLLAHVDFWKIEFCDSLPVVEDGRIIGHGRKVYGRTVYAIYLD